MFKFTGCNIESTLTRPEDYFKGLNNFKVKLEEYSDNCILLYNPNQEILRFSEINSLLSGITFRNCYMTDKNSVSSQPPFTFWCKFPAATIDCNEYICPFQSGRGCAKVEKNASFPWLHFENNIYNHFTPYANWFTWKYYLKAAIDGDATYRPLENEMGTFIGAYSSNCYKIINEKFVKMKDIMAIE